MSVTQEFTSDHILEDGKPAGGETYIDLPSGHPTHPDWRILYVKWQDGPLGAPDDPERLEPNGLFVETLIAAAMDRIVFYETASDGAFSCEENQQAIANLDAALQWLNARTERRIAAGTEGTHAPEQT